MRLFYIADKPPLETQMSPCTRTARIGRIGSRVLLAWLVIQVGSARAEDGHSVEHAEHRNHLAFIIGHAEEEQKDGHHESGNILGFEYVRKSAEHWGWGVIGETEVFGDDQNRQGIIAFPLSYFPNKNWRLFAAPGIEFREPGHPEHFMFRIGTGYEFRVGRRMTISPEVEIDFVTGGTRVFMFALAFGIGF